MNAISMQGWATQRLLPTFAPPQQLTVYDIRSASSNAQLTITTLAGLINRVQSQVYLLQTGDDVFWLQHALSSVPTHTASATGDTVLAALLQTYCHVVQGLILYDPALVDTINVATTLAGQRDGIVIAPTQAQELQQTFDLPILVDLRAYGWHTRLQAYDWAQHNLLTNASTRLIAGISPTIKNSLRSFLVATRTFTYWLDSRQYLPTFSDGLLSERALMEQILVHFAPGTAHLGWFVDESSGVRLTSQAALPVLATDYFTNLEVWTSVGTASSRPGLMSQPTTGRDEAVPTHNTPDKNTIYVSFTISDGDNLQYNQRRMSRLWSDKLRGTLPVGWTISPVLTEAAPTMAQYYLSSATPNDELIAGPSGAGYIFPSHWPIQQLEPYLQQTGRLMQEMHLHLLAVLDTNCLQSSGLPLASILFNNGMIFSDEARQQSYAHTLKAFGLEGILSGAGRLHERWQNVDGIPLYHNLGLASSARRAVWLIKQATQRQQQRPLFLNIYMLAWNITLADIQQVMQLLGNGYQAILPGTLLAMLKETSK